MDNTFRRLPNASGQSNIDLLLVHVSSRPQRKGNCLIVKDIRKKGSSLLVELPAKKLSMRGEENKWPK